MHNPVAQLLPSTSSRSEADLGTGSRGHRAASASSGARADDKDKQFPLNDHRYAAPSRINWLCNSSNASSPIDTSLPRRPPTAHALGRSASSPSLITAQAAASPYRHASLMSNQSLQLDMAANRRTEEMENNLTLLHIKPLSPIAETRSPTHRRLSSVECSPLTPGTPGSVDLGDHGSTYSAFLKRSLKRTVSQASSSSLRTTGTTAPTAPTLPPLDLRPTFVSHRTGPQLFSTVYEDANSERTGSFVTAEEDHSRSNTEDGPPTHGDADGSTTRVGESDTARRTNPSFTHELTHSPTPFLADADAPPVPRSPQSRSSSFIWDRWRKSLSFGSARPSFRVLLAASAGKWRANVPVVLFWAGFAAPWCWLIGGWLVAQGEAEKGSVLPLWKPSGVRPVGCGAGGEKEQGVDTGQVPEGTTRRLWKGRQSVRVCMRWSPFTGAPAAEELTTGEEGINVIEEKEARARGAWVMRCRIAAFVSGLLLMIALVVALVVAGRNQ